MPRNDAAIRQRHRESSDSTSKRDAQRILRQRIGDRETGKIVARPERVTLADLQELVEKQYDIDGRRSKSRIIQCWNHLVEFFGAKTKVPEVRATRLDDCAAKRLADGAARQTVNNELAALRRGFKLAVEKGLVGTMPTIKLPKVHNARSGFVEDGEFAAVLLELPPDMRDLVQFLRCTGWRRDEGRLLQWANVDRDGGTIRLGDGRSKSGKPRVFPFGLAPTVRHAWEHATKRAGVPDLLVHDLRRSAARDFRRAGVSEGEIMRLAGWETRSMFDRYNIINEQDLAAAVAKRFGNGKQVANIPAIPAEAGVLSERRAQDSNL